MSRTFVPTTVADLKRRILIAMEEEEQRYGWNGNWKFLTPTVEKDLSKVQFDTENMELVKFGYDASDTTVTLDDAIDTMPNGLVFLSVCAGGDWESPCFFILYFNGKQLRGYIPKEGNCWNTDTKKAYGNDDKADVRNARKRWPEIDWQDDDMVDCDWDWRELAKDITDRIKRK